MTAMMRSSKSPRYPPFPSLLGAYISILASIPLHLYIGVIIVGILKVFHLIESCTGYGEVGGVTLSMWIKRGGIVLHIGKQVRDAIHAAGLQDGA